MSLDVFDANGNDYAELGAQDFLESLGDDIPVSAIRNDIQIEDTSERLQFAFRGELIGYIDYTLDDGAVSLDFIGNINMSEEDAEAYQVDYEGLNVSDFKEVKISGLGEYMLQEFIKHITSSGNDKIILTAELDNPYVATLFYKLQALRLVNNVTVDTDLDEKGFTREFLEVSL